MSGFDGAGMFAAIGQNAMGAWLQQQWNKMSMEFQEKMYGIQRQHAIEDRDYQNTYNSPVEQMKRLKDANLNPFLIYGKPEMMPAAQTRAAEAPQPAGKAYQPNTDMASVLIRSQELEMQRELMAVQKSEIISRTMKNMSQIRGIDWDNKLFQETFGDLVSKAKWTAKETEMSYYLKEIQEDLTDKQIQILKKELENKDYEIQLRNAKTEAETKKIKTEIVLNYARTLREAAQAAATEVQARKMTHEADRVEKLVRYQEIDMLIKTLGIIF